MQDPHDTSSRRLTTASLLVLNKNKKESELSALSTVLFRRKPSKNFHLKWNYKAWRKK